MSRQLPQPISDLGASFFFAKYTFNQPPFGEEYHDWLAESYSQNESVLRAAIEAVGMAGISNISYAPNVASRSNELYCKAVVVINQALCDPVQVRADATLMAVILLGLFETVNFDTWDRYGHWDAHVKGATALLELRGKEQFTRRRGGLLYILTRSQILAACAQQHLPVPLALVKTTYNFQRSTIRKQWQLESLASAGSICEICFRLINLSVAFKSRETIDSEAMRKIALDIDSDLENWRAGMSEKWKYASVDADESAVDCFMEKRHVYSNLWIAENWNNWRMVRILVNQILHQIVDCPSVPSILSLIRPLYVVSLEVFNSQELRGFAVEHLRHISAAVGIRQAGLLAKTVSEGLEASSEDLVSIPSLYAVPLIPFF
ncbi:hypothetical protein QQX98_005683 [Neonectria punicea]|uniref:Transcription factor domain-containing protein n=1 Tax=Neonectria punicea TaxID=979145 RepID=A0ABR1H3S6_9HYPO